ncbi:MAG TPA: histidine phosphatase family protein, partial [Desulfomonilaceae bacterium]|nr:histidine phosphatase family protein [Desulfomonilaceae bacterium]
FNRDGLIMGRSDSPLTSDGIRMAKELARIVQAEDVQAVYCSPLGRAVASAGIYVEGFDVPMFLRESLAELSCGRWEGRRLSEVKPGGGRLRTFWEERPPGGESYQDAEARIGSLIQEACSNAAADRILVVSHAGAMRVFLKLWLGLEPEIAINIGCPHDRLFILTDSEKIAVRSVRRPDAEGLPIETLLV